MIVTLGELEVGDQFETLATGCIGEVVEITHTLGVSVSLVSRSGAFRTRLVHKDVRVRRIEASRVRRLT